MWYSDLQFLFTAELALRMLLAFVLLVVLYQLWLALYNITLHPLAGVPGYRVAGMTRLYHVFWCYYNGRSQYYRKVSEMHRVFGPIVRISPNEVSLSDPHDFERVYNIRSKYTKDLSFYQTMGIHYGMFGASDNDHHRKLRAPWNEFFSKSAVSTMGSMIRTKVDLFCQRADEEAKTTNSIPIQGLLHSLMIDIVSEYTLPECRNALHERPYATHYASNVLRKAGGIWLMTISNFVYSFLNMVLSLMALFPSIASEYDELMQLSARSVEKCTKWRKGRSKDSVYPTGSLIERILDTQQGAKLRREGLLSNKTITDEVYSFNLAAVFNFGMTMSVTLYHILSNRIIYERLRTETLDATSESSGMIETSDFLKLPYLSACINEGLRMGYGPIGRLPRVVPSPGEQFQGHLLPAGIVVGVWAYVQHHTPDIWGDDHDTFNPDRWLDADRARRLNKYLMTFGKDNRQCIGKELALVTMHLCLASLIAKYPDLEISGQFPINDLCDHFAAVLPADAPRLTVHRMCA